MIITSHQRHILRHSLGLDREPEDCRNYYVSAPRCSDYPACVRLVALGLMEAMQVWSGGRVVFAVTKAGVKVAKTGQLQA